MDPHRLAHHLKAKAAKEGYSISDREWWNIIAGKKKDSDGRKVV
jgi:hypothetical protein